MTTGDKVLFCPTINAKCVGEDCRDWCSGLKDCWHRLMWSEEMESKTLQRSQTKTYQEQTDAYKKLVEHVVDRIDGEDEEDSDS